MHYQNKIKRFLLRKDFFKRARERLRKYKRLLNKNEFDDIAYLFHLLDRRPKVIFDCGANIGFVTHQLHRLFPEATVHAFEPNPTVFKRLDTYYQKNTYVRCHNIGVGDIDGQLRFNINKNSGTSSFLAPNQYHKDNLASSNITVQEVPVVRLGSFMEQEGIEHVDILKLDIEGFEIKAMSGIPDLSERVSLIFTEVNLIPTYQGQPLIEDITSFLREKGFQLFNFYGINENKNRQANITNLLFMSPQFRHELINKGYKRSFSY